MQVAEVTTPRRCASRIPREISGVRVVNQGISGDEADALYVEIQQNNPLAKKDLSTAVDALASSIAGGLEGAAQVFGRGPREERARNLPSQVGIPPGVGGRVVKVYGQ